jgi:asparagine synthase (glutamine-hydrolysing)
MYPVYTFTIGDTHETNSAKGVVSYLESKYNIDIYQHIISVQDISMVARDIDEIINVLETYSVRHVRNAIPMTYMLRYISNYTKVKVLLSGDGLDEICGTREFYDRNDSDDTLQTKTVESIEKDVRDKLLCSDKLAGRYGLEVRYPYLDVNFIEYMLSMHPKIRRPQVYKLSKAPIEKYIVRKAVETCDLLPNDIIWREHQDITQSFTLLNRFLEEYFSDMYSDKDLNKYVTKTQKTQADLFQPTSNRPRSIRRGEETLKLSKETMHYHKKFHEMYPRTIG